MNRRNFLQTMMYSSSVFAIGGLGTLVPTRQAFANHIPNVSQRTLVNTMLVGGADLRYLFVPDPNVDPLYTEAFWSARKALYQNNAANIAKYPTYESVYADLYTTVTFENFSFGIYKNAQWLIEQFEQGNVAIISNVVGSSNRRHDHSQLIMHTGDINADQYLYDRDGWGGRFVSAVGGNSNVVAMSDEVSIFCNGTVAGQRLNNVVHMRNSRDFALPGPNEIVESDQSILARSLKAYYQSRGAKVERQVAEGKISADWPFRKFFQHEHAIRTFGDQFADRVMNYNPALPRRLQELALNANNKQYATEIGNVYDSIVAADILSMRCAYLEYPGWDTHRAQKDGFEKNIEDLFGTKGGMDTLTWELDLVPGANENLAYVFTSDFGRQLAANGANGTDHGRGTYMIVVGRSVKGGVYGEMFPQREYQPEGPDEPSPFQISGRDIEGRTSYERVLSELCEWVEPNTGSSVFPTANDPSTILEANVDLSVLFKPGFGIRGTVLPTGASADVATGSDYVSFPGLLDTYIDIIDSSGKTLSTKVNPRNGVYWLGGLASDTYDIIPMNSQLKFDPPQISVTVSGGHVFGQNFTVDPRLSLTVVNKLPTIYPVVNNPIIPDGDYRLVVFGGYNFVTEQTSVSVGGINSPYVVVSGQFFYALIRVGSSGEIRVSTPTETYIHHTLYEEYPVT